MITFEKHKAIEPANTSCKLQQPSSHYEEINLPYSVEQLFDLVADIEHYPDFLPGWKSVKINKSDQNKIYVTQELGFPLFSFTVDSVAKLDRPHHLFIAAEGGPFQRLEIDWHFKSISSSISHASLSIEMDAYPGPQQSLLQQFLNYAAGSLLVYFERRAKDIYEIKNTPELNRGKGG